MSRASVDAFLAEAAFAVVGASNNRDKYGNKVLRCYAQNGRDVVAVHPHETSVEGKPCYARLTDVPGSPRAVSVVAPPAAAATIVEQADAAGVKHLWFQPGAEHDDAIADAERRGIAVIHGGPCLLVALGFRDV